MLSVMVFLLHVGRLPLTISRIVSRNRILCEAALSRRQNTGHIPGKKSAANKRVYTVVHNIFINF